VWQGDAAADRRHHARRQAISEMVRVLRSDCVSAWGHMDTTERAAMIDRERIAQIIAAQGCSAYFRCDAHHSARAAKTCSHSVYVRRSNVNRRLGDLGTVEAMSEEQLRDWIVTRFAQPTQKGRAIHG